MDIQMENEVNELVEMLYNLISDARSSTFARDKCTINRDEALSMIDDIKAQLPVEISEAKRLVSARNEFVANAKREAESIRKTAEEQARTLVEEQEITRIAKQNANDIITKAENRSRDVVRAANEYVDDAMRRTEEAISAALNEVTNSRARYRNLATKQQAETQGETVSDDELEEPSEN